MKIQLRLKNRSPFYLLDQFVLGYICKFLHKSDIINLAKAIPHRVFIDKVKQIKQFPKRCASCLERDGTCHQLHNIRLCTECRQLPQYKLVCKTTAKKAYFLTDKDLAQIQTYCVPNPYYKCAPAMILVTLQDVYNYFCHKHRCNMAQMADVLNQKKTDKEARRGRREATRMG